MTKLSISTCLAGIATAATLVASAAQADSFRAYNRVVVNPVSSSTFEAIEQAQYGPRGLWCAAADYAQSQLGARGTDRVYVQTPRGNSVTQSGRKGVVFGLSSPSGVAPVSVLSVSSAIRVPGSNLSVDHAYQFCYDSFLINSR